MLLQPRKFKYKNIHKRRRMRFGSKSKLRFGSLGLQILNPLRLTSSQIFRFKLFLKKSSRRFDKTLRFTWFNVFPYLPVTRKVEGSRMGKGKGKLSEWHSDVPSGIILFEFKNLRFGRSLFFTKQIGYRLPSKYIILSKNTNKINLPLSSSKFINYDVFW